MASDSAAHERTPLPHSDEEEHPAPTAAPAAGADEAEGVASAPAVGEATPEEIDLRRRRDKAIEILRAVYGLPEGDVVDVAGALA